MYIIILFCMCLSDYVLSMCFDSVLLPKKPLQNVVILNNSWSLESPDVLTGLHIQDGFFTHISDTLIQVARVLAAGRMSLSFYMSSLHG